MHHTISLFDEVSKKENKTKKERPKRMRINNGKEQRSIIVGTPIPDGWKKGGLPLSEEHKASISKKLKQYVKTPEHLKKISENHKTQAYKDKRSRTCLEKYGVEHPAQAQEIKDKTKQYFQDKFGVDNPSQTQEIKDKKKATCMQHFGVEYPQQSKKVQQTLKNNNLEKYGVEYTFQVQEVKDKIKATNLEKYGVENPIPLPEIREKVKQTIKERYGVEHHLQSNEFLQKQINTNLERRGIMYNIQLPKEYTNNSKPNQHFAELLDKNNIEYTREFPIDKYSYDFKIGGCLIEINPFATHNSLWGIYDNDGIDKDYHYNKTKLAEENGYRVIHIFDWDDEEKIIGMFLDKEKIYGRKCEIKEIQIKECNDFLNQYHIQNSCKGQKVCLGLFYNDKIVSVMTFGKPRYNKN